MIYDLRKQLYNKILKMPIYWFDKPENNPSNLQILLSDNVAKVNFLISTLYDVVVSIFSCVVSAIIIAFYHSWQISLVSIGFILFQVFCGVYQQKYS
jgi:ABC-type multidrug transport system fused ATPase/permease subunit